MKRFLPSVSIITMLAVLAGCTTTGQPDILRISAATQEAARLGTSEAVRDHPEWRPTFVLVASELSLLAAGTNAITVTTLLNAIEKLPVSELSSDTARLAISAARLVISIANWSDVEIVQTEQVRPVVQALANGINAGLNATPVFASKSIAAAAKPAKLHYKAKK